jgi:hypothetical protein
MPHWADPCTLYIRYKDGTDNGAMAILFVEVPNWLGIIRRSKNIVQWAIRLDDGFGGNFMIAQSKDN